MTFIDSNGNFIDGSGVSIAILDSGIDFDHPFFGPDEDNNGLADKIAYQYDFGGDYLRANNDSQGNDTDGHGTHVASIAASSDPKYPGVAPGATLLSLKIFPDGKKASGRLRDVEEALKWVLANKDQYNIVAVNLSIGDGNNYTSSLENRSISDEFSELAKNDITVVSAAGNNGGLGVSYPAADPYSLAVSAVNNQGKIANFSQHDLQLTDAFAPGVNITAAKNDLAGNKGQTISLSGTSMAAPHVSGAIAIAQQLALQELDRRLSFDEIQTLLKQGDPVANQPEYGKKLLNITKLGEAILQMSPYDPTTHLTVAINGSSEVERVLSYGGKTQDVVSEMTINDTEKELKIEGNTWKKIELGDYKITENTVLEFEFASNKQGEVHAIGFDNDNDLSSDDNSPTPPDESHFFKVYGTQEWGIDNFNNYFPGEMKPYQINVGEFFTGSFNYLVVANDDDASANAESVFRNIKLYEELNVMNLTTRETIDLSSFQSYGGKAQDIISQVTIDETGTELKLEGNTWKKIEIYNYKITENTILEFEFKTEKEGEIHAIGFDNDNILSKSDASQFFKIYGTQKWGLDDFNNYSTGEIQTYQINVGEFLTGSFNYLVLANDDDANANAESIFSNVKLHETTDVSSQNEVIDPLIGNQSLDVFTLDDAAYGVSDHQKTKHELLNPQSDKNDAIINLEQNIKDDFLSSGADKLLSETTVLSELNQNDDLSNMISDNFDNNVDHSSLLS